MKITFIRHTYLLYKDNLGYTILTKYPIIYAASFPKVFIMIKL